MEKIIVIGPEDDHEFIEAIKNVAGKDDVKALGVIKGPEDDASKVSVGIIKSRALRLLGAALVVLDMKGSSNSASNNPEMDEQLRKSAEELNTILTYREPSIIQRVDNKSLYDNSLYDNSLYDNSPCYDRFIKEGRARNYWRDKSKFKKKGGVKR